MNKTTNSQKLNLKPSIVLSHKANEKIKYWVDKSTLEISGLGKCTYDKEHNRFFVSDVWLLEQENSAASTDIDAEAAAKLLFETKDMPGDLNFWWHSHVNMNVFWSGTDTDTIGQLGSQGYCLASVFNKKGEVRSAYFFGGSDTVPSHFHDDIQTYVSAPVSKAIIDLEKKLADLKKQELDTLLQGCEEEYTAKCKPKTYHQKNYNYGRTKRGKYPTLVKKNFGKATTGKGTKASGQTFSNNFLTKDGNIFYNVLDVADKDRMDGSVHPTKLELRWCSIKQDWVKVEDFFYPIDKNLLDDLACRFYYATKYKRELGHPPMTDEDIETYFMELHNLSWNQVNYVNKKAGYYDVVRKDVNKEIMDSIKQGQKNAK